MSIVCYTHNHSTDLNLIFNKKQESYMGICFETQHSPNGINIEGLEDSILRKGEIYKQKTLFKFSVEK